MAARTDDNDLAGLPADFIDDIHHGDRAVLAAPRLADDIRIAGEHRHRDFVAEHGNKRLIGDAGGCDLVVLPETFTSGFSNAALESAEDLQGATVRWMQSVAEETGAVADNLAFVTLHEAIDPDFHAVIAVFGGRLTTGSELAAADDAAALHWLALADIEAADAAGRTTPGLYDVARKVLATCAEN